MWRHPSEVAAEEHALARAATAPATTRMFAITTGTLGLLAVGLLMLAVTPRSSLAPVAISVTTTPDAPSGTTDLTAMGRTPSAAPPATRAPIGIRSRPDALATPIGAGRLAVVTATDLAADVGSVVIGTSIEVSVPSGRMRHARIVGVSGDTVLIELDVAEPGLDLADERPAGHEMVTVLAEPPVTVVLDDLPGLDVEEGTAVLDDDGDLIGLCSDDRDETRLIEISEEFVGATSGG